MAVSSKANIMTVDQSSFIEESSKDESLLRLYQYWDERRGKRRFPARGEIDLIDFTYALGRVSGPKHRHLHAASRRLAQAVQPPLQLRQSR
jgi:hypothetical protein